MSLQANKIHEWYGEYADSLDPGHLEMIRIESLSTRILNFNTLVLPALLQTQAYAENVITQTSKDFVSKKDLKMRVHVRMQRQQQLFEARDEVSLRVLLDESILQREVGGRQVFIDQLYHLLDLMQLPNVALQVLPFTSGTLWPHVGTFGFDIYYIHKDATMSIESGFLDHVNTNNKAEVTYHAKQFDSLCEHALSEENSRGFILRRINELEEKIIKSYPSHG